MKILVAVDVIDLRKGVNGLVVFCKKTLEQHPLSGKLVVFRNRRATAVKALVYDGQGFWLCQKRLSSSRFAKWSQADAPAKTLVAHELLMPLAGGIRVHATKVPDWHSHSQLTFGYSWLPSKKPMILALVRTMRVLLSQVT